MITKEQELQAAIESLAHHMGGVRCTAENFQMFKMGCSACALCVLHKFGELDNTHEKCILYPGTADRSSISCSYNWRRARMAQKVCDFPVFHKYAVALVEELEAGIEKLKREIAEEKKPGKPEQDDKYKIGYESVAANGVWEGYKCKLVRFDKHVGKYESHLMFCGNECISGNLGDMGYPDGTTFNVFVPVVRCSDPRFWTVERDGVLYRAYIDDDGNTRFYWRNKDDNGNWFYFAERGAVPATLRESIILFTTDYLDIPIMPQGYMGDGYRYEYPILAKETEA